MIKQFFLTNRGGLGIDEGRVLSRGQGVPTTSPSQPWVCVACRRGLDYTKFHIPILCRSCRTRTPVFHMNPKTKTTTKTT
ncbi:hypothetical protein M405DRAFT_203216 [Rhizopogon salebrosus TDB-379]|nr:hypothetical protein M405DRAFT_203216 [Rhizopogon salebrosus TDB-379]